MSEVAECVGEWPEPVMVTINGKEYATQLYNGVQRFVPDPAVERLVKLAVSNFRGPASGGRSVSFYEQIPASLRAGGHPNAVVNLMVEKNKNGFYSLNEVIEDLHRANITIDEWLEFETLHGWSVDGFYDSITSQLSNLGLGQSYVDEEDGEEYESFDHIFELSNPNWE